MLLFVTVWGKGTFCPLSSVSLFCWMFQMLKSGRVCVFLATSRVNTLTSVVERLRWAEATPHVVSAARHSIFMSATCGSSLGLEAATILSLSCSSL